PSTTTTVVPLSAGNPLFERRVYVPAPTLTLNAPFASLVNIAATVVPFTTSTVIATGRSGHGLPMRTGPGQAGPARMVPWIPDGGPPMAPQAPSTSASSRRPLRAVDLPGIEDPLRIERIFHPFHQDRKS